MPGAISAFPNGLDTTMGDYDPLIGLAMNNVQQFAQGYTGPASLKNVFAQAWPDQVMTSTIQPASGTVECGIIWLQAGRIVNNLSFVVGNGAASTPTNHWAGLAYPASASPLCVAISADATTTAIAVDTVISYAMSTPYVVPTSGRYLYFWCFAGTTVPILAAGLTLSAHGRGNIAPFLAGPGDTGKTSPYAVGGAVTAISVEAAAMQCYFN